MMTSSALDDALELAATLEEGVIRRLAALVACSYPRVELTTLSYRHQGDDQLGARLATTTSNRDRCIELERWLSDGNRLALSSASDRAAEARMLAVLGAPSDVLPRVRDYATQSLRRLFNQRNLIMHSGTFRHVALDATLRTAPGLVGQASTELFMRALRAVASSLRWTSRHEPRTS